jgi:uncharacterized protein with FMN-binding domain
MLDAVMASNRLSRGIVSLAASAITAIYVAGYVHTSAADTALASPSTPAAVADPAPSTARPTPTVAPWAAAAPSGTALKDGTYTGVGTSRRGDIQVSLSVQGGRIASVNITGASTQYPTRFIANLPNQVVSRQSPQVDTISGATYSSLAFRGAVQQALQRAQS